MPTNEHETPLDLVRLDPSLPAWVQTEVLGDVAPAFDHAELVDPNVRPSTYQGDAMVVCRDKSNKVVHALVYEIQRGRDVAKLATWKIYVGQLEARFKVPAPLLVLVPDRATAAWYGDKIAAQASSGVRPVPRFFTPADLPRVVREEAAAAHPARALFADLCNLDVDAKNVDEMFPAMLAALAQLDPATWLFYDDEIKGRLSEAAQKRWETFLMTTAPGRRYRTRLYNELDARAEARGVARSVLTLLEERGVAVPAEIREQINACTDSDQLDLWFHRAVTATTASDVLRAD
ncbi:MULTISPECIES: hypothetical protein [unclassified Pseudofrankia]|uniref:hypothetical protein n=1 Tax=unclassified Pseudofrankia TaxID=2994372 RepID=UPI0008D9FAF1|nr:MULTISPECIES: hypothetical protein [unclassified Pseudofrankia]MDT3440112.1 hypothetical protein [Pseudofrankia sp. BMG5.37]OHV44723.1 hypothetical protein BCD48_24905 [Pseudofrankia sp. BMG5.36]